MKKYKTSETSSNIVQEPAMVYDYQNYDDVGIFGLIDLAKKGVSFKIFDNLAKKFPFTLLKYKSILLFTRLCPYNYVWYVF